METDDSGYGEISGLQSAEGTRPAQPAAHRTDQFLIRYRC